MLYFLLRIQIRSVVISKVLFQVLTIFSYIALSKQDGEQQQYYLEKAEEYQEYPKKPIIPILKHTFEQDDQSYKFRFVFYSYYTHKYVMIQN